MEILNEQQFNALTDNGKYNVYKDLAFERYSSQYYWESTVNRAKDGNLFEGIYNADFIKEIVDTFGYAYVVEKLIDAQKKKAEEESKDE
ncbi:hypothetical protein [Bacteroides caecimuris]|uniref:hypothetical protein n=1 Tax=Bacteroides caecimuris TaxID=1796613 RepID=UPI0025B172D2|nr:hypothetical protein [Bacteroides caecimuris]